MDDIKNTAGTSPPADTASIQISDAIDKLLSNPELLSTVASAIGVSVPNKSAEEIKAQISADTPPESKETASDLPSQANLPEIMATMSPLLSAFSGKDNFLKNANDPRSCLLRALKPYVNPHRQEAIDMIIKFSSISELIKKIK